MKRRGFCVSAWVLVLGCLSSCGVETGRQLSLELVWGCGAASQEVLPAVTSVCVAVQTLAGNPIDSTCARSLAELRLPLTDLPAGRVLIALEAYRKDGTATFRGRSGAVSLTQGDRQVVRIPVALVGQSMLVAGLSEGCSGLPYATTNHAASVFSSGHVLVTGGGGEAGTAAAYLFDPIPLSWEPLETPASLVRADHTATPLLNGRLVILGGSLLAGDEPTREVVVLGGGGALAAGPYDPTLDYLAGLQFAVLQNELVHDRPQAQAAAFFNGQILIQDGLSPAEMYFEGEKSSAPVVVEGGEAFPQAGSRATVVPLEDGKTAVVLGGAANHGGTLEFTRDSRTLKYRPSLQLVLSTRNRPVGLAIGQGRAMFLGGLDPAVQDESPVVWYDPVEDTLTHVKVPAEFPFEGFTATVLPDPITPAKNRVFVAGGFSPAELFDPQRTYFLVESGGTWVVDPTPGPRLLYGRAGHTASLLPDGRLLLIGGFASVESADADAESQSAEVIAF